MPYAQSPTETRLIQEGVDSFRLVMPRRILGKFRWIGLAPLIFGLGIAGFFHTWMSGPLQSISSSDDYASLAFSLFFGLLGLPGLLGGIGLAFMGLSIIAERTYSEISVNRHHLRIIEHFGFLRWSWKRPSADLASLSFGHGIGAGGDVDLGVIRISMDDGKGLIFAVGYPATLLQTTSEKLARLLDQSQIASGFDSKVQESTPDKTSSENDDSDDSDDTDDSDDSDDTLSPRYEQSAFTKSQDAEAFMPAGTKIIFTRDGDACAFSVPPSGMFRGAALFTLIFSMFFIGFPTAMAGALVREHTSIGIVFFLGIFIFIGLAILAYSIKTGTQRVLIAVTPDALAYQQTSLFGITKRRFAKSGITAIGVGPSGTTVNDKPIPELKVSVRGKGDIGLLQGVKVEELRWIAATLRATLKVG